MKNVWKVGMTHVLPDLMIGNSIAYAFGDSMEKYISQRKIGNVKKDDIVFIAKSMQQGVFRVGVVKSSPYYCLPKINKSSFYREALIQESSDLQIIKLFETKNHSDVVYFHVDWLPKSEIIIDVSFDNLAGFTAVNDKNKIIQFVETQLSMKYYSTLLLKNRNIILTGAPGTGKTFLAREIAKSITHENVVNDNNTNKYIDVDDFKNWLANFATTNEGKPFSKSVVNQYRSAAGHFARKDGGLRNVLDNIENFRKEYVPKSIKDSSGTRSAVLSQLEKYIKERRDENTYSTVNNGSERVCFVQFHPSYDYTDFVEGLRPIKKDDVLGFELRNGIFKDFCRKAYDNPSQKYVFIIDEINRGDLSKIFGELFFSIDPGYRGENGKVKTQYANIQTDDTIFSEEHEPGDFFIPDNVYIIGTMNDIDRSVESFDFAMRRRFTWVEISPESRVSMWDGCNNIEKAEAVKKMTALNKVICQTEELGSHFQIGPAYFLKLEEHEGDYDKLWQYHIEPLLKEYLRGTSDMKGSLENMKEAYGAN